MNNNDIFKKLRVALMLRDDQIIEILSLVDFRMSKGEIGNLFRNADHPDFVECGDQVLRNFLNGLVIHLRGTKDDPKNPTDIIDANRKNAEASKRFPKDLNTKTAGVANTSRPAKTSESAGAGKAKKQAAKPAAKKTKPTQKDIMGKVRFNNGKNKK